MSNKASPIPNWVVATHATARFLGVLSACLILVGVFVICQMVYVRSVLGESSIWQTEFTTFCILGATFLGSPYILLTRGHVGVDIVPLMVRNRRRFALFLIGHCIALVFCVFFLYSSIPWWYDAWHTDLTTASVWRVKLWMPYLTVPIGLFVLCMQFLADMWLVITHRESPFGLHSEMHE